MPVTKEGYPFIIICLLIGILFLGLSLLRFLPPAFGIFMSIFFLFITIIMVFFFRDPERRLESDPQSVFSPADGKIIEIKNTFDPLYLKGNTKKIAIFMSLFDVHINRAPIEGKIGYFHYEPGKFFCAFKEKASSSNERVYLGIENETHKIMLALVAGIIARRIIVWKSLREEVFQGERIGMIRFGSRVEMDDETINSFLSKRRDLK